MWAGATVQRQGMSQESLVPRESEDRRQGGKYWGGAGSQLDDLEKGTQLVGGGIRGPKEGQMKDDRIHVS